MHRAGAARSARGRRAGRPILQDLHRSRRWLRRGAHRVGPAGRLRPMKILYLGPARGVMLDFIAAAGDEVVQTEDAITAGDVRLDAAGFIVSYGYRHLLAREIVTAFARRAVNLHISLLPWNRG